MDGCVGVGWGELNTVFSVVRSLLLQIRVDSASWVSAAFKVSIKKHRLFFLNLYSQAAWAALWSVVPSRLASGGETHTHTHTHKGNTT